MKGLLEILLGLVLVVTAPVWMLVCSVWGIIATANVERA
jgi:hypothetical protein